MLLSSHLVSLRKKLWAFIRRLAVFLFPILLRYAMIRESFVFRKQNPPKQSLIISH